MTFSSKCFAKEIRIFIYLAILICNTAYKKSILTSNKGILNLCILYYIVYFAVTQSKGLIEFLSKRSILRSFQLLISQNGVVNVEAMAKWLTCDFKALTSALKNLENLEPENSIEQKGGGRVTSDGAQRWTVYSHCAFAHGAIKTRIEWRSEWAQFHRAWNTDFIIRLLILRHRLLSSLSLHLSPRC